MHSLWLFVACRFSDAPFSNKAEKCNQLFLLVTLLIWVFTMFGYIDQSREWSVLNEVSNSRKKLVLCSLEYFH